MDATRKALLASIACVIAVMALAALVRCPSAMLIGATPEEQAAYTTEQGLPYLIDMDSYYHVRIADNDIDHASMGDAFLEDGTAWDTQSFYPEGRTAEYRPGIVKLTEAAWSVGRLFGTSLYQVQYCLAALMAALAALVAFLLGYRMAGRVGGFLAGVLVACTPVFVARTAFGRYDTDMFVVLLDTLMLLMLVEALRARTPMLQVCFSFGFGLSVFVYAQCWTPRYAVLLAGLLLVGALLYVTVLLFAPGQTTDTRSRFARWAARPELRGFALSFLLAVSAVLAIKGPLFFTELAATLLWAAVPSKVGVLPDVFVSISELEVPDLVPGAFAQWFAGYVPGMQATVLNGVGGVVPMALCFSALAYLAYRGVRPASGQSECIPNRSESVLYFCVLGVFFVGCFFAMSKGVRFIEHFAVPVGILAGAAAGWFASNIGRQQWGSACIALIFIAVLCAAAVAPSVVGSAQISAAMRPSATDASAQGMAWIRDNAEDPQAVIFSWWDNGYFYESESGHPCVWDGGSMDGIRSILVGKALTTDDAELSRCIVQMLVHSGNRPINYLMEHVDAQTAFDAVWEALPLPKVQAVRVLESRCGLTAAQAAEAEALLHPAEPKETYLVLTRSMLAKQPWFEYFANWDFEGSSPDAPHAQDGVERHDASDAVFRRLLDQEEPMDGFTLVFDGDDGVERMTIWRIDSR